VDDLDLCEKKKQNTSSESNSRYGHPRSKPATATSKGIENICNCISSPDRMRSRVSIVFRPDLIELWDRERETNEQQQDTFSKQPAARTGWTLTSEKMTTPVVNDHGSTTTKKKSVFGKIKRSLGLSKSPKSAGVVVPPPRSSNVSYATSSVNFATGKSVEAPTTVRSSSVSSSSIPSKPNLKIKTSSSTAARPPTPVKKSWLTRTKFFRSLLDDAFETVDQDSSGTVDEKELYSGLLLIHLKLGTYAGPAACKPISQQKCHSVFQKMDVDQSGNLDRDEFDNVMCVLFGNVLLRVLFQYACTLMLVPILAQYIYNGFVFLVVTITTYLASLDDDWKFAIQLHAQLDLIVATISTFVEDMIPGFVQTAYITITGYIDQIPDSVWDTIPITLLSTILSLMIIPWSLLQIDDFFQYLAERNAESEKKKRA
jgi:EF hand